MNDILCPNCGHDIDLHDMDNPRHVTECCEGGCGCGNPPSAIARALLTAEPTDVEVNKAGLWVWEVLHQTYPDISLGECHAAASCALSAAVKVRSGQ